VAALETSSGMLTIEYEEVALRAQHFLKERPVIVLGTGATIPHGLPSMRVLAESLLNTIDDNPLGWQEFAKRLDVTKDLERALHQINLPQETIEQLVKATWQIMTSKDLAFYQQLIRGGVPFPLAELFRYLLRTVEAHVKVVTTNYDRLAEYAANYADAYASTGATPGWLQRFVPVAVTKERPPSPGFEGRVTVLKVHGSLDWFRDSTGDVIAVPLLPTIPLDLHPLIVTPGIVKYREVHKDPFRTVMSAADTVLREASCVVCVGYGFNDEHVQPVLINRVMKDDVPLVIVTKELTKQTRYAFLDNPPKQFLFLEEAQDGTRVYLPEHPGGALLKGASVWQLSGFVSLLTGGEARN
jgi:hypothetical protein